MLVECRARAVGKVRVTIASTVALRLLPGETPCTDRNFAPTLEGYRRQLPGQTPTTNPDWPTDHVRSRRPQPPIVWSSYLPPLSADGDARKSESSGRAFDR